MKFEDLDLSKTYTYADYLLWQFQERLELIKGKIFRISPAPSAGHQQVSIKLLRQMVYFFDKRPCQVFHAPFDVRLHPTGDPFHAEEVENVVQPDICVICDPAKIDIRGCKGAPDWIIEILSPSTMNKDVREKYELYEACGVKEYWVVHPADGPILVFTLDEHGKYFGHQPYTRDQVISPTLFPDLKIDLSNVFPEPDLVEEPWAEYMRL